MKELNVYLHFNGQAREALKFYVRCFDGEIKPMQTYADSPMDTDEKYKDLIMHAEFKADHIEFMAADGGEHQKVTAGNQISLSINLSDEDEQTRIFESLSENGKVLMPLEHTFWGARFGMVEDRFGVHWMLNVNQ